MQMYAIEEKRMKLDECLMAMEERRWKQQLDREDQCRREQQDWMEERRKAIPIANDASDVWTASLFSHAIFQGGPCVLLA